MAGSTTSVDEEMQMLRMRLSNLEETIEHLTFIKAQTEATHKQDVASLQARIKGRLDMVFSSFSSLIFLVFFSPGMFCVWWGGCHSP